MLLLDNLVSSEVCLISVSKLHKPFVLQRRKLISKNPYFYTSKWLYNNHRFAEIVQHAEFSKDITLLELDKISFKHKVIPVAVLIDSFLPFNEILSKMKFFIKDGFRTFKFKVGKNLNLEAECLKKIRIQFGNEINIRLDANRALELEKAIYFGKKISNLKIEYFEEPVKNPFDIRLFYRETGIFAALDETLIEYANKICPIHEGVNTYAIKPFLMPNLNSVWNCFHQAGKLGMRIAVCSAFESSYSLSWLVLFAAMCNIKEPVAAGLSTYQWFVEDNVNPSFRPINGTVLISTALSSIKNFNFFSYKLNTFQ